MSDAELRALIAALRSYKQADEDGVFVLVSRQACDEAATALDRLAAAEADAARLEWMQKNLLRESSMRFDDGSFKMVNAWAIASTGTDLRAAIDAAREAGK